MNILASYPRSGNTWVKIILNCVVTEKAEYILKPRYVDEIAGKTNGVEDARRVSKSHALPCPEGIENKSDFVYIVRDPRSVYYSCMNHGGNTIEDVTRIEQMVFCADKGTGNTDWSEHVKAWVAADVLIVRYEDLVDDTLTWMRKIVDWYGFQVTQDDLKKYIEFCSFDQLRAHYARDIGAPHTRGQNFFWKGRKDSWREMPEWIIKDIEEKHAVVMKEMGYEV